MAKKRGFKFPTVESAKAIPAFVPPVPIDAITIPSNYMVNQNNILMTNAAGVQMVL